MVKTPLLVDRDDTEAERFLPPGSQTLAPKVSFTKGNAVHGGRLLANEPLANEPSAQLTELANDLTAVMLLAHSEGPQTTSVVSVQP